MQTVLQKRETTNGTLATGLLLGLWIAEVLAATEYWVLKTGTVTLTATTWLLRRWALIVVAVAVGVAGGVTSSVFVQRCDLRTKAAFRDVKAISDGTELYRLERGYWPATLEALVPRFIKELHVDPWGRNYAFYRGEGGIAVVSAGPDRELGTGDDLIWITRQH